MKKFLLVCFLMFLMHNFAASQTEHGMHVGTGIRQLKSAAVDYCDIKAYFNVGYDLTFNFKNGIFIRTGLDYAILPANKAINGQTNYPMDKYYTDISSYVMPNPTVAMYPSAMLRISVPAFFGYYYKFIGQ